jgi:hypothetical protein
VELAPDAGEASVVVPVEWLLNRLPRAGTYAATLTLTNDAAGLEVGSARGPVEVSALGGDQWIGK